MPKTNIVDSQGRRLSMGEDERARIWQKRISSANEYYDLWSKKYQTEKLEEYYYGKQWEQDLTNDYEAYVSNRFFVAIDVKMPSLLFQNPRFTVKPRPTKEDFNEEEANERAKLRQDILDFYFDTHRVDWGTELNLSLLDSQFAFGIIEVLFTSDWIENPNAGKPVLLSDISQYVDKEDDEILKQPKRVPVKERAVLKRIPSKRFRVSTLDHANLDKCAWWAYWEYFSVRDLEANENYDTSEWNIITTRSGDFDNETALRDELDKQVEAGDLVKLWKIFDNRAKTVEYWPEGHDNIIRRRSFKRNTIVPLKFRDRLSGFYPLPPTYNWKSPQDELNEVREMARVHRRRFVRKFVAANNAFDDEEFNKLQYGGDGAIAQSKLPDARAAIAAMPNPDLGAQHFEGGATTINDFDNTAGVSAQQRGEAGGKTATESNIIDKRSSIRESRDREIVADWLCSIAKIILQEIKERTTLDFWIKVSAGAADDESQLSEIQENWIKVTRDDLTGDEDFDVEISVTSMSPVTQQEDKARYIEFLSIVQQFPVVAMSPHLIRETANKLNYRNENVIRVMQKIAQAVQLQQLAQAESVLQAAMSGEGESGAGQLGQKTVAQNQPNTTEQIRNQMANQSTQVQ